MNIFSKWAKKIKRFFNKKETKDALSEAVAFLRSSGLLQILIAPMFKTVLVNSLTAKGLEPNKADSFADASIEAISEMVNSTEPKAVAIEKLKERLGDPDTLVKLVGVGIDKANMPLAGATIAANVAIVEVKRLLDCL